MEILDSMDSFAPEKRKNLNKNARNGVLDAVEDRTLESHSRGPGFESLCAHTIYRQIGLQYTNNLLIWGLYFYNEAVGVANVL